MTASERKRREAALEAVKAAADAGMRGGGAGAVGSVPAGSLLLPPASACSFSSPAPPAPAFPDPPRPPAAFPTAKRRKVQAFGSFVHGISLPGADLDVVVSGLMTPISRGGGEWLGVLLGVHAWGGVFLQGGRAEA